jgi:hypothetical protein
MRRGLLFDSAAPFFHGTDWVGGAAEASVLHLSSAGAPLRAFSGPFRWANRTCVRVLPPPHSLLLIALFCGLSGAEFHWSRVAPELRGGLKAAEHSRCAYPQYWRSVRSKKSSYRAQILFANCRCNPLGEFSKHERAMRLSWWRTKRVDFSLPRHAWLWF